MARTVDLLPEIFRTPANQRFLNATLDQLTQEADLVKTRGFVGRRNGTGISVADSYVTEPTAERANYQLEPAVAFLKPDSDRVQDVMTYPGMLSALSQQGADVTQQSRLWQSDFYTWDSFCDIDKFVNYSQYYWLPYGPDSVTVGNRSVPLRRTFDVTRAANDAYTFTFAPGKNPKLRLVRGGNYEFQVDQSAGFWIQSEPGTSGTLNYAPNVSSRDVLGVENNGDSSGTITFRVPSKTAQDFFYNLADIGTVDLVTELRFTEVNNQYVDQFLTEHPEGIDGITSLNGRTVIFVRDDIDVAAGGWQRTTRFDPLLNVGTAVSGRGSYDSLAFDETTDLTELSQRYVIFRINYVEDTDGKFFMQVVEARDFPSLSKASVTFGNKYSSTQWYKDAEGYLQRVPLLTATQDRLYYQDAQDPRLFGEIELLDPDSSQPLDVNDIVGARSYVSPNGVTFTNGLKIKFDSNVTPVEFADQEYYVEGVGTGPDIGQRVGFVDGEAYYGAFHTQNGQRITGSLPDAGTFQQFIYDDVQTSIVNRGTGTPESGSLPVTGVPGVADGNGIRLIPVTELVTPETYTRSASVPFDVTGFDDTPFDSSLNAPTVQDYVTVNRASRDRNAWSRSNRWFHVDVIRATADYTGQQTAVDNAQKARRPIIEFRANLRLFDMGTQSQGTVSLVDDQETDAFTNVAGKTSYSIDGVDLVDGMRVIFSADLDPEVRNRIYRVELIDPDGEPGSPRVIRLVDDSGNGIAIDDTTVTTTGLTGQGITYRFDGVTWQPAQQKTNVNQPPLFDVFDSRGYSLSDRQIYVSSNFAGSRLFGYADSDSSTVDPVLGFPLSYLNINNIGDIRFSNYFFTDTFVYVDSNNRSQNKNISIGSARQYVDRVAFGSLIGWLPVIEKSISRQVLRFEYDGSPLVMDVAVRDQNFSVVPVVRVYVDGKFVSPDAYRVITTDKTQIEFLIEPGIGASVETQIISDSVSRVGYFQVPANLENNALNLDSLIFTLGSVRQHYESVAENLIALSGEINGANNIRDLGNVLSYGEKIIQHSSPAALAGVFLRRSEYDIFDALRFNGQEYEKYKARLIDTVSRIDVAGMSAADILDQVISELANGRNERSPFYWSDMLPAGSVYNETVSTVTPISTQIFDTLRAYDFSRSNYQGLSVYLNGRLLTRNAEYTVSAESTTVTLLTTLSVGDQVRIREYLTTYGNYVPNTPTKMGLYPAWQPRKFIDDTYRVPAAVIQGHDGSITIGYGDIRDDVLLEFETRIYNNLKVTGAVPLLAEDVIPGRFRGTDYALDEVTEMLGQDFLSWVGQNRLDFTTQSYSATDPFTYNYNQSADKINGSLLPGAWRGINRYFYDTQNPTETPWEMLGFAQQPSWWESVYGPAPYTEGNLVLWEDLANGIIADPTAPRVDSRYQRPGLLDVIPAGSEGSLLPPLLGVVGNYDETSFRRSWAFGDGGPTESAWRNSSAYPFAVMRLLALTKPAEFFSLFADRDRYRYDTQFEQYLWDGRYRLEIGNLGDLYGSGISKASYINWIVDYNLTRGIDSSDLLSRDLQNIDIRLAWRVAGYTDKRYLKIYTERSTPSGENLGFLLPDESYQILLYENVPTQQTRYSSVIVQRTESGWQVQGYDISRPYFEIFSSRVRSPSRVISAGGVSATVPTQYSEDIVRVPYGYTFTSRNSMCDFLLSYGQQLQSQGLIFGTMENGYIMDWNQMCQEFLYWSNQGWVTGSLINLNPAAQKLSAVQPGLVARSLVPSTADNLVLNQNRQTLTLPKLSVSRLRNNIDLLSQGSDAICFASLDFMAYEHVVVLDNRSLFNDLVYDPITGNRQSRVLVSGWVTGDWDGTVTAPGFVINQDNVEQWNSSRTYTKGDIVIYKDRYWSARYVIQPSEQFDFNDWLESDYQQINKGLLPNTALSSDQLANAYDVYASNLENDVNLFSYGLIGFRPRQYMQALSLDDVSQVNLYRQFLGTKGTQRSAEIFTLADIGKETAEYDIYEHWAMLQGRYGATDNRRYVEILLDQARLPSDPSLVQIIEPQQVSSADQTVLLQDLWRQSFPTSSTNIFQTTTNRAADSALPTAGYVNIDDVDYSVFDLDSIDELLTPLDSGLELDNRALESVGEGTVIWVARVNDHDWNIYRCSSIDSPIVQAIDNLDGTLRLRFAGQHGLSVREPIIVRFFDAIIDGSYRVASVPDLYSITVPGVLPNRTTQITGTGVLFRLDSVRISQPTDLTGLPFAEKTGTRAWIDDVGDGRWGMLQKTDVFSPGAALSPRVSANASGYSSSVSQGLRNLTALVGAPNYQDTGAVYVWLKQADDSYAEDSIMTMNTANVIGFGTSIDIGDSSYGVIGAPGSINGQGLALIVYTAPGQIGVAQQQILLSPDGDYANARFGQRVTMSQDERWAYVSAPGAGKIYAYNRIDVQTQTVSYRTDGSTYGNIFNYDEHLVIDSDKPAQMIVSLADRTLQPGTDFVLANGNVVLTSVPEDDVVLTLSRRKNGLIDKSDYFNVEPSLVSPTGNGTGAAFAVDVRRGFYNATITAPGNNYSLGDVITIEGNVIGETTPSNDLQIEVTQTGNTYFTTSQAVTGDAVLLVNTVQGLRSGQNLVQIDGTGSLAANTAISSVDDNQITAIELTVGEVSNVATVRTTTSIGAVGNVSGTFWANSAPSTVDNVTLLANDTVLVLDQSDLSENGLYRVISPGTGNNGSWLKTQGGINLDQEIIRITGPLTPDSRVPQGQNMRYRDSIWQLRAIKQVNLTVPVDLGGTLIFFADTGPITAIDILTPTAGIGNTASFDLKEQFYQVDGIDSVRITVDGNIYTPNIDYTMSGNTVTFVSGSRFPAAGASIAVEADTYFRHMGTVRATDVGLALDGDLGFGESISTTSDGRQLLVGAPSADHDQHARAGNVYVFDRSCQTFIYQDDSDLEFVTDLAQQGRPSVLLNGRFLTKEEGNIAGNYTVQPAQNAVTILAPTLTAGDVIEIETNHFRLLQTIQAQQSTAQAQYGFAVDACVNDCSIYVSAPYDSRVLPDSGMVEFWQNQARVYGMIQTVNIDPVLTAGHSISVNGQYVKLSQPETWDASQSWQANVFVIDSGQIYRSLTAVPMGVSVSNTAYWAPSSWLAVLAADIMQPVSQGGVPNTLATVQAGRLTIAVKNLDAAPALNRLRILPGTGSLFNDLGVPVYAYQQEIRSPYPQSFSHFGQSLFISDDTRTLVIGAPDGNMIRPMTLDRAVTTFDASTTAFRDTLLQSGAVYVFDQVSAANPSVSNPNKFVFGQEIVDQSVRPLDRFGAGVDYTTGTLLIGVPGSDTDGSTQDNTGNVSQWLNPGQQLAWQVQRIQQPTVDVSLFNRCFVYDRVSNSISQFLDVIDPLQGRLLGPVQQNIDYISPTDPAAYNTGSVNNYGVAWNREHTGEIWWDTSSVRFLDPNQNDTTYASRRWAQIFAGSTVVVYQWIESDAAPAEYTGPGRPRDVSSYTTKSVIDDRGIVDLKYYFWITDIDTIDSDHDKTLSVSTIARYIENPRASGIPYMAAINSSTVALYNVLPYVSSLDTVLHIEFDRQLNQDKVHSQYQLIPVNRSSGFLDPALYTKMIDSFAGVDSRGAPVPDFALPPSERYGTSVRPRQSFFVDRILALKNYLEAANRVLANFPVVENRRFTLLNSNESEPSTAARRTALTVQTRGSGLDYEIVDVAYAIVIGATVTVNGALNRLDSNDIVSENNGAQTRIIFPQVYTEQDSLTITILAATWNKRVLNGTQLSYQTIDQVPVGYRYLVAQDENHGGLWSIYEVTDVVPRSLLLVRVQTYDTRRYWEYTDWYASGYSPSTRVTNTVSNVTELDTLTGDNGAVVKVTANAQGRFELYVKQNSEWTRIALQLGTIRFRTELWDYELGRFGFDAEVFDAQYYDENPFTETRQIIRAINEELLIEDLARSRNRLLIEMFRYILSEQQAPDWIFKTSLIDVDHTIRDLAPYPVYRQDNQDFVIDYIQEVKPYHTQIREFNLKYNGQDSSAVLSSDFDVPAFYDSSLSRFISPVLDDSGELSTISSRSSLDPIWQQWPWSQWYNNYTLTVDSVAVTDPGSGYTVAPTVEVIGTAVRPAVMTARITSDGRLFSVEILDSGLGYVSTPTIVLRGGNGTGARAVARMDNALVRRMRTVMRFDRFEYRSNILDWIPGTAYVSGSRVRYADIAWQAPVDIPAAVEFDPTVWSKIDPSTLSGVDRTQGFYTPNADQVGRDLAQLITGIDYPGAQVQALDFQRVLRRVGDGSTVSFGFSSLVIPFNRSVPKSQRVTIQINGQVQRLDVDYTISFDPAQTVTFETAPGSGAEITIEQTDPFELIGDVRYQSAFNDSFLGTNPAPGYAGDPEDSRSWGIKVDGGEFVDTYASHAPEELLPGSMFDTLDLRVYQTPGSDWDQNGHGFPVETISYTYDTELDSYSWSDLLDYPVTVNVFNTDQGRLLTRDIDYEIDWINQTVTVLSGATSGEEILLRVTELGGGNHIYRDAITGDRIINDLITLPVSLSIIDQVILFVNGNQVTGSTLAQLSPSETVLTLPDHYGIDDLLIINVMGATESNFDWSAPVTEWFQSEGELEFQLTADLGYSNPANMIVTINGRRARPWESVEYISDGTTVEYLLPSTGGISQSTIADNDVLIYVNDIPLNLNSGYVLDPLDGSSLRAVTLTAAPPVGHRIVISVRTDSSYLITDDRLVFKSGSSDRPFAGDRISVTTFNDTREQRLLTQVWKGPTQTALGVITTENFDMDVFDPLWVDAVSRTGIVESAGSFGENQAYEIRTVGTTDFTLIGAADNNVGTRFVATGAGTGTGSAFEIEYRRSVDTDALSDSSGSWDFSTGVVVTNNRFDTGRTITDASLLRVSLDGAWFTEEKDYTVDGSTVILRDPVIGVGQIVAITTLAQSVLPGEMRFRVFKDMRGSQYTYRITQETTTELTRAMTATDDTIYVLDASRLSEPDVANNQFGFVSIDGERIAYRGRDLTANTLTGLRRGVSGTAAADHAQGADVIDMSEDNQLLAAYQDQKISELYRDDASTSDYVLANASINDQVQALLGGTVSVSIDGTTLDSTQWILTSINTIGVRLLEVPAIESKIVITVAQITGETEVQTFTANGFTPNFTTTLPMVLQQSAATVIDYSPITVVFPTAPAAGQTVTITTRNTRPEDLTEFEVADGVKSQFSGSSDLGRYVSVMLGGSALPTSAYTVTDIAPVTVRLQQELSPEQQLEISVAQGRTWYQPGVDTASDGNSLQITDTPAARFLRGF